MTLLPVPKFRTIGTVIPVAAGIDAALVVLGLILTPTTIGPEGHGALGAAAALVMLAAYGIWGVLGSQAVERRDPRILQTAGRLGLAIGSVFVAEILFEYLVLPSSKGNERLAYVEFGGMFLFLFLAGFIGGRLANRIRDGVLTAIWSAMIGSLAWVGGLLSTYYMFFRTARQDQVLAADQVFEDFKRSGMTDLRAFIMQDYLGGIFFHLLLGLIVATVLGTLGALTAKLATRLLSPHGE